jgi:hypothetical protein
MTITLELPPEGEAWLLAQAAARGLTLSAFVATIIESQAAAADPRIAPGPLPRESQDLEKAIDAIFDTVQVAPGVGEGAMRRENWYS